MEEKELLRVYTNYCKFTPLKELVHHILFMGDDKPQLTKDEVIEKFRDIQSIRQDAHLNALIGYIEGSENIPTVEEAYEYLHIK